MIEVINLTKSFGDLQVLKGINLTIEKGEKVVIIGPSGSGKSTFLRCLNCMEDPTSGSVLFNGVDLTDMKVDINVRRFWKILRCLRFWSRKRLWQNCAAKI